MTEDRVNRFKEVVRQRQSNLTVILENVHDHHNIGAVLRTCDSVGIKEIFVLYTEPQLDQENLILGARASSGARKWIDVNFYTKLSTVVQQDIIKDLFLVLRIRTPFVGVLTKFKITLHKKTKTYIKYIFSESLINSL